MSEIWKLDKFSFVDTRDNSCINFGKKDISRVVVQLNWYEDLLDDYEKQLAEKDKEIAQLKESLKQVLGFLQYKVNSMSMFEDWAKLYKGE